MGAPGPPQLNPPLLPDGPARPTAERLRSALRCGREMALSGFARSRSAADRALPLSARTAAPPPALRPLALPLGGGTGRGEAKVNAVCSPRGFALRERGLKTCTALC